VTKKKKAATQATPPATTKNSRRSVRNPDACLSWREQRERDGWRHVQFWARPIVVQELDRQIAERNAIDPLRPRAKAKQVIEDLILAARL